MNSEYPENHLSDVTVGPFIGVTQGFPATFRWRLLSAYAAIALVGIYLLSR